MRDIAQMNKDRMQAENDATNASRSASDFTGAVSTPNLRSNVKKDEFDSERNERYKMEMRKSF